MGFCHGTWNKIPTAFLPWCKKDLSPCVLFSVHVVGSEKRKKKHRRIKGRSDHNTTISHLSLENRRGETGRDSESEQGAAHVARSWAIVKPPALKIFLYHVLKPPKISHHETHCLPTKQSPRQNAHVLPERGTSGYIWRRFSFIFSSGSPDPAQGSC